MKKYHLLTITAFSICISATQAAVLADYTNDAIDGPGQRNFLDEANADNVTADLLRFEEGARAVVTDSTTGETNLQFNTGNPIRDVDDDPSSMSSANAQDRFVTFTITAAEGFSLNLTTADIFTYTVGNNTENQFRNDTHSLAYVSDQADFSNILFESDINSIRDETNDPDEDHTFEVYTLNPTTEAQGLYQTLHFAVEVTVFNNNNNNKRLIFGDFSFDGNVIANPVPEPSSSALLALSGLALLARRRR